MNKEQIYNGVYEGSLSFFHTPSQTAQQVFYYLLAIGSFRCNKDYLVERTGYNNFLLIYIRRGKLILVRNKKQIQLKEGNLVLVDCYEYHKYFTNSGVEFDWVHFDGIQARAYYELLEKKENLLVLQPESLDFGTTFSKMITMFQNKSINESRLSQYIVTILTLMCNSGYSTVQMNKNSVATKAISYIYDHLEDCISLEDLAKLTCVSSYYFIRIFKKETGYTPHEFIVETRINQAKYYLLTTTYSIKEIGINCGFINESTFYAAFKKHTGHTPSEYRNTD